MKLFPKLALMVSGLLIGTTLCLSLAFYMTQRHAIEQQADQERRAILQNLVHIAQESFLTNDDLLLVKYTGWLQQWNPALVSASVVAQTGEVIAHSEPDRIGKTAAPIEAAPTEVLVLTQPVRIGTHWIGTASAGFSQRYFHELIRTRLLQLQKRVIQVAMVALFLGLAFSFLIALSWTQPIGRLAQAAGRIGQGKYDFDLTLMEHRRDELGYLSKAFETMARQLRELDQMKEDFVSAVTHELRSPLGAIESYLNLIAEEMREGLPAEIWQSYLDRLRVNTQRLTKFVNDLLDVAALERGKVTLEKRPVSLPILVQDVAAFFDPKIKEKRLTLEVQRGNVASNADADPDKIRQVLINLLSNAIKFTPENGRIDIHLHEFPAEKQIRVAVKDSGIGISEQDQVKVFSKFEQVKSARQDVKGPKGTGLGLSIARTLVELHGGLLSLESKLGEGSTFFFTLPVSRLARPDGHSLPVGEGWGEATSGNDIVRRGD